MKNLALHRVLFTLTLIAIATLPGTIVQAAPVSRVVADQFEISVQFMHEPAILGDTNGPQVRISRNGDPVSGLADSLIVQVEYMEAVRVLNMTEDADTPGVYQGVFIPMQAGDYSVAVMVTIDDVEINEVFTVADGLISVTPRTDYEFPNAAHGWLGQRLAIPALATGIVGAIVLGSVSRSVRIRE